MKDLSQKKGLAWKPKWEDIVEIKHKLITDTYSGLHSAFSEDERFYELDFKSDLDLPDQFAQDAIVLPTARDMVDAFVDFISIDNARVSINKKGTSDVSSAYAEMMRRFGLCILYMTNVEADISPWRLAAKSYAKHGLAVIKTVYDPDAYLPIVIQAVNPRCILPDPSYGGRKFVIEVHKKICFDVTEKYHKWTNPKNKKPSEEVEFASFWTDTYRCDLVDDEPVLAKPVLKHDYGFIPYTLIDSGLGDISFEAQPEMRYVGLLRYMKNILIAESMAYSMHHILIKRETLKGGYITGRTEEARAAAKALAELRQEYGSYPYIGDIEVHDWEMKVPPSASFSYLAMTHEYITSHGAPDALRGLSEEGVRSGADRRYITGLAAARFKYSVPAFKHGAEKVLRNCALLAKNVVPENLELWARTKDGNDFDVEIDKDKMKEPFNFYVEFAPASEEDEYRRHDDIRSMVNQGIYTDEFAWTQMSNVDPTKMVIQKQKAMIRQMPGYVESLDPLIRSAVSQAVSKRMEAEGIMSGEQEGMMPQEGMPQEGMPQETEMGGMVPPIPERAQPGSAQEMENQLKQTRRPPATLQGQGGGGNRSLTR